MLRKTRVLVFNYYGKLKAANFDNNFIMLVQEDHYIDKDLGFDLHTPKTIRSPLRTFRKDARTKPKQP